MGSATDIAWAAGFLDGEGYFGCPVRFRRPGSGGSVAPEITAGQNRREPLDKLVDLFGGNVCMITPRQGKCRTYFRWQLNGACNMRAVLPLLLPYLTAKLAEAEVLLEIAMLTPESGYRIESGAAERRIGLIGRLKELRAWEV